MREEEGNKEGLMDNEARIRMKDEGGMEKDGRRRGRVLRKRRKRKRKRRKKMRGFW